MKRNQKNHQKEKGIKPEIIYTTEDIYNETIKTYKPLPIIGYTPQQKEEISNNILILISSGLSTTKACNKSGIDITTFNRWKDKDEFLYRRYVRACESLGVALFDRILDEVDSMTTVEESIIASKKIEALKWLSGKMNQRFSDRSDVYIQNVNNTLNANTSDLNAEDRAKLMKSILSKLNNKIEAIGSGNNEANE